MSGRFVCSRSQEHAIHYLKELKGEFACSVRVKGKAKRDDLYTSQILDFGCLMQPQVYEEAKKKGVKLYYPELKYCTDNAAMIASCGYYEYINGKRDTLDLNAYPSLQM